MLSQFLTRYRSCPIAELLKAGEHNCHSRRKTGNCVEERRAKSRGIKREPHIAHWECLTESYTEIHCNLMTYHGAVVVAVEPVRWREGLTRVCVDKVCHELPRSRLFPETLWYCHRKSLFSPDLSVDVFNIRDWNGEVASTKRDRGQGK